MVLVDLQPDVAKVWVEELMEVDVHLVDGQEAELPVVQAAAKAEPRQVQQPEQAVQMCLWLAWQW